MALLDAILTLSDEAAININALASSTASAQQQINRNTVFAINATQDITIKVGDTGMGAAASTDFRIPSNVVAVFQMPPQHDFIRVFNLSASATANVYIQKLSRF